MLSLKKNRTACSPKFKRRYKLNVCMLIDSVVLPPPPGGGWLRIICGFLTGKRMLDGNKGISDNRKIGRSNKVPHFDFRIVYGARCVTRGFLKRGIGSCVWILCARILTWRLYLKPAKRFSSHEAIVVLCNKCSFPVTSHDINLIFHLFFLLKKTIIESTGSLVFYLNTGLLFLQNKCTRVRWNI